MEEEKTEYCLFVNKHQVIIIDFHVENIGQSDQIVPCTLR